MRFKKYSTNIHLMYLWEIIIMIQIHIKNIQKRHWSVRVMLLILLSNASQMLINFCLAHYLKEAV